MDSSYKSCGQKCGCFVHKRGHIRAIAHNDTLQFLQRRWTIRPVDSLKGGLHRMPNQQKPEPLTSAEILREIGDHLRWWREAWETIDPGRHSQQQWAEFFGIQKSTLSRWESGTTVPNLDKLVTIVLTTGATMDYVFFGVYSPDMPKAVVSALREAQPGLIPAEMFATWRGRFVLPGTAAQQFRARPARHTGQEQSVQNGQP